MDQRICEGMSTSPRFPNGSASGDESRASKWLTYAIVAVIMVAIGFLFVFLRNRPVAEDIKPISAPVGAGATEGMAPALVSGPNLGMAPGSAEPAEPASGQSLIQPERTAPAAEASLAAQRTAAAAAGSAPSGAVSERPSSAASGEPSVSAPAPAKAADAPTQNVGAAPAAPKETEPTPRAGRADEAEKRAGAEDAAKERAIARALAGMANAGTAAPALASSSPEPKVDGAPSAPAASAVLAAPVAAGGALITGGADEKGGQALRRVVIDPDGKVRLTSEAEEKTVAIPQSAIPADSAAPRAEPGRSAAATAAAAPKPKPKPKAQPKKRRQLTAQEVLQGKAGKKYAKRDAKGKGKGKGKGKSDQKKKAAGGKLTPQQILRGEAGKKYK